jgi:hypothetical protein
MVLNSMGKLGGTVRTTTFYGLCWTAEILAGFAIVFSLAAGPAGIVALQSRVDFSEGSMLESIERKPADFEQVLSGLHETRKSILGLMNASLSGITRFLLAAAVVLVLARAILPARFRPLAGLFRMAILLSAFGGSVALALWVFVRRAREDLPPLQTVMETAGALDPKGLQEALIISAGSLRSTAFVSLGIVVLLAVASVWLFVILSKLARPAKAVGSNGVNHAEWA